MFAPAPAAMLPVRGWCLPVTEPSFAFVASLICHLLLRIDCLHGCTFRPVATGAATPKSKWPGLARPLRFRCVRRRSVERLYPHDRGTVIAANPQHRPPAGFFHEHAPDVGRAR